MRTSLIVVIVTTALVVTAAQALAEPPHTALTSAPFGQTTLTTAQFAFSSDQAGTFECSLDLAPPSPCQSPLTLSGLPLGAHTFTVRAINGSGEADPQPPSASWSVVTSPEEPVALSVTGPKKRSFKRRSLRSFAGTAISAAPVSRVQIAVTFGGPDKNFFPPKCWYVDMHTGKIMRQLCVLPPYVTVKGTSAWRFPVSARFRKRIPRGRYRLLVRALNSYGATFSRSFHIAVH